MAISVFPLWRCEITLGNFNGNCARKYWSKASESA